MAVGELAHYENAGPVLLASTPPTLSKPEPSNDDWPYIYPHLEARLAAMRTARYSWWRHGARIAQYILPYRYKWAVTANSGDRGNPVNESIYDSTATIAMRICASSMLDGMMSAFRPWFRLGVALPGADPDEDAQLWLDDTTERMYAVLAGSNFYTEAAQMFEDLVTFGTSPMIIYEDHEDIIRCYVPAFGEYFLASGARLSNDTFYREFTYTVSQIVDWFGLEACPQQIRTLWQTGGGALENEFIVGHAIEPNFAIQTRGGKRITPVPGSFTYREFYWLRGQMTAAPLSRRGFPDKPFVTMRWSKTSNDPYGRGPGHDAVPDSAQLQQETLRKGEIIDKIARPSMGADPSLENQPSSQLPGEVTYINTDNGKKGFWPLYEPSPQALPALTADIEVVQKRLEKIFYNDVFLTFTQMEGVQPRNEWEIAERKGEKLQRLGPVATLVVGELHQAIQRISAVMTRRGLIKPMPRSLHGVPIKIEFESMMKLAQLASETAAMERTWAVAGKLSEGALSAGLPSPFRTINVDESFRIYGERIGYPQRGLYSADDVAIHDKAKAQQAQAQQMAQATLPVVQAAEGLSKIDVGGGQSAVQALLGTQPAGGA